jgi:ABC-type phosphate/phosphonate transport system ATPase subunit
MTASEDVVLDIEGLRMRYGTTDVLHGVTFQVRWAEVVALLGPNGAGKPVTGLRHSLPLRYGNRPGCHFGRTDKRRRTRWRMRADALGYALLL